MKTAMKMMRRTAALLTALVLLAVLGASALGEETGILKKGDSGEAVRRIQEKLIALGYLAEGISLGTFDDATEQALLWFQSEHDLLETGMADRITLELLEKEDTPAGPASSRRGNLAGGLPNIYAMLTSEPAAYAFEPETELTDVTFSEAGAMWLGDADYSTEEYTRFESNGFVNAALTPLSTFAADVDTSSYALLRRKILSGDRVSPDAVRVEEMLNYFRYDYAEPAAGEPFGVTMVCAPCPWNPETRLLQIGLQARTVTPEERPAHNLVFLIDTSGSMEGEDRLDQVKRAFLLLLETLSPEDTVSVVTYASSDRVLLEGVPAGEKTRIMDAISDLEAYGSTNGSAGLTRAYEIAEKYRRPGGVSRILLATDGDLNVGLSSEGDLARLVAEKKEGGVSLTCLGFGMGNYKDNKMEALADYGDGNCWYIDTIHEARKALVTEAGGTFITVAKDVKLQADFNPAYVRAYRLIGYEDRLMAAEDFADDAKDGGEIGSGHQVTVLYEIVPAGSDFAFGQAQSRYQTGNAGEENGEMLTVAIRAKEPEGTESALYEYTLREENNRAELNDNMKFAAAVAETAMLLRDSEWKGNASWASALDLLRGCSRVTGDVYREEFLYLVTLLQREAQP